MTTFDPALQFGIKEVADVAFYTVGDLYFDKASGKIYKKDNNVKPKLKFDTLKTSGLEFTGETTEARGGKGNAVLISWDHSREATFTLEDALLSADSLRAMLSNKDFEGDYNKTSGDSTLKLPKSIVISVDANGFPDTYTVVGKTYARAIDGTDHLLTFLIFKAKVNSEANFEMSADGDPSTLNMTLKVLRCTDGDTDKSMGAVSGDMIKMIIDENTQTNQSPEMDFDFEVKPA